MTPLRRFALTVAPFFFFGACAELIGLNDYETGEEAGNGGEDTRGGRGGSAGSIVKPGGMGGEEDGGSAGVLGGRAGRGGRGGAGGAAGEPDGGDNGQGGMTGGTGTGGTEMTGGSGMTGGMGGAGGAMGGAGGSGGSGGSPVCTEITIGHYLGALVSQSSEPYLAAYDFELDPEIGTNFDDYIQIQFWDSSDMTYDGGLTGSFTIGEGTPDANYAFCSRCIIAYQDQDTTRETAFFQTSGVVTMANNSRHMEGYPVWTLTDVTLREVTIDADDISTVVPGGECIHIADDSFSVPPPDDWVCSASWYYDTDCDCGCGQFDPVCTSADASACRYCWCDDLSPCMPGEVSTTSSWVCTP